MVAIDRNQVPSVSVFEDRRGSTDFESLINTVKSNKTTSTQNTSLNSPPLVNLDLTSKYLRLKETNFDAISSYTPSEMDRSMGSIATFMTNSPANFEMLNHRDFKLPPKLKDNRPANILKTII